MRDGMVLRFWDMEIDCPLRTIGVSLLAVFMAASMMACSFTLAEFVKVAEADLPVLLQIALGVAQVASLAGANIPQSDIALATQVSSEASKDLQLIKSLYDQYKASGDKTLVPQIEAAIGVLETNLPRVLSAAHFVNELLRERITAAATIILTTVTAFAGLIPQPTIPVVVAAKRRAQQQKLHVPKPRELKNSYNTQVLGPTGNAALDSAFAGAVLR